MGEYSNGADATERQGEARLTLHLPKPKDLVAEHVYHNRLMRLCGVGYAALTEAVMQKAQRKRKVESAKKKARPKDAKQADSTNNAARESERSSSALTARRGIGE